MKFHCFSQTSKSFYPSVDRALLRYPIYLYWSTETVIQDSHPTTWESWGHTSPKLFTVQSDNLGTSHVPPFYSSFSISTGIARSVFTKRAINKLGDWTKQMLDPLEGAVLPTLLRDFPRDLLTSVFLLLLVPQDVFTCDKQGKNEVSLGNRFAGSLKPFEGCWSQWCHFWVSRLSGVN